MRTAAAHARTAPRGAVLAFLCVLSASLLAGCSLNPALRVGEALPPSAPSPSLLASVPFHPQTEYQCGPAALAGVLGASGVGITPESLVPQVYLPGRQGSLQAELLGATRRAGRIPYVVDRTPEALFAELQAGRPVLVLQNLLVRTVPKWHYAVLVGADARANRVVLNSGTERGLATRAPTFLRTWDWGGRWGMVALRPGELPANADAGRYLSAVADFEPVAGAAAAAEAYRAAATRWPDDPRPLLALGNQAYARGERDEAAREYRRGLSLDAGDPVLANNLASVLGELGCRAEALRVLDGAQSRLAADSRWRTQLADTRAEVSARKAPSRMPAACATHAASP